MLNDDRPWIEPCSRKAAMDLNNRATDKFASAATYGQRQMSGSWLKALPIISVELRMADNVIRVDVEVRLRGIQPTCVCVCGHQVDARGTHGMPKEGWKAEWDHGGSLANW